MGTGRAGRGGAGCPHGPGVTTTSPAALAAVEERVRCRKLEGAPVAVQRLPQTDSVRVRAPGLHRDLLELYFENRRSGGGRVRAVRVLPGGRAAIVSFQEPAGERPRAGMAWGGPAFCFAPSRSSSWGSHPCARSGGVHGPGCTTSLSRQWRRGCCSSPTSCRTAS